MKVNNILLIFISSQNNLIFAHLFDFWIQVTRYFYLK